MEDLGQKTMEIANAIADEKQWLVTDWPKKREEITDMKDMYELLQPVITDTIADIKKVKKDAFVAKRQEKGRINYKFGSIYRKVLQSGIPENAAKSMTEIVITISDADDPFCDGFQHDLLLDEKQTYNTVQVYNNEKLKFQDLENLFKKKLEDTRK